METETTVEGHAPTEGRAPSNGGAPDRARRADPAGRRSVTVTGDRLLVAPPPDAERRTKTGILIPATAESVDRKGIWGEVLAIGPHARQVATGDEVLYLPDDAIEVDVQDEAYLIVRERDVHAIASSRSDGAATGLYL